MTQIELRDAYMLANKELIDAEWSLLKSLEKGKEATERQDDSNVETSDHGLGAAADIKFTNTRFKDYRDIAQWIVQNIPHRQVLLEYTTNAGTDKIKSAWIHVAFLSNNGKLVRSTKAPVQTFVNNESRYTKLVNLA
jgi:hypothetical protein